MKLSADSDGGATATLFLLSSLTIGGSERKMIRLANHLAHNGKRVMLAYLDEPHSLISTIDASVQVWHLQRRGKFSVGAMWKLLELVRNCNVAVVIAVNLYPALYAVFAKLLLPKKPLRVAVSINTTEFHTRAEERQMLLYRWILRMADKLIFGATAQRDIWCQKYGLSTDPQMAFVLHNGVDTDYFDSKAAKTIDRNELPQGELIVGTVGKLRSEKGHLDLVRATRAVRARGISVGALIVGDGPQRDTINSEIDKLELRDFIRIAGDIEDVRPWLAAMDVFALTSTAVETFSNAALEAMSMGKPVISSRVGGMEEMLRFGGGTTYQAGDVDELCEHLERFLSDSAMRERVGRQARQIVVDRFGWDRMVGEFVQRVLA